VLFKAARREAPGRGEAAGRAGFLFLAMPSPCSGRALRGCFGRRARAALLLPAFLPCAASMAATTDTVVVTASRAPQPLSSVLADFSVVDRSTIERSGATGVADVLARLPGIEFARNGGPGTTTSVFIRGSETRHTAVYIDGVRVDSQSTGGAPWEQIPLDQIERIEVLRGPAAAVYGSDAVAGVVQLFTRRGRGAPRPTATLTAGSFATLQAQAGISGASDAIDYALSLSHGRSDGFNARTTPTANPDEDGWRRRSAHLRAGLQLHADHRLDASLLATRLRSQYDSSARADDVSHHGLRTASLAWQGQWSEASSTRAQLGQTVSTHETQPSYYRTETTLRNLTLQHEQRVGGHVLNATLERREDALLNPAAGSSARLEGERHQDAVGLGWRGDFGDRGQHGLQAHVRHDEDSGFGGKSTGSLAWGWTVVPRWRITAAAATSFRVPTLYQRFSRYGNAALVPESGRNLELGLRWDGSRQQASLTVWRHRVEQLITFGPPGPCVDSFGCYANVGQARLRGLTLAGRALFGAVTLHGSFDWHDPRNLDTGQILARRARRLATVGAETAWAGWTLGADLQAAGMRFENAANTQRLGGYGLVNLNARRALAPGLALEARVDNATGKRYELARTYATAGRSAQLSLRWAMP
jgi:vitamin B12 transporter